jgi:hypothetical protein
MRHLVGKLTREGTHDDDYYVDYDYQPTKQYKSKPHRYGQASKLYCPPSPAQPRMVQVAMADKTFLTKHLLWHWDGKKYVTKPEDM